MGSPRRSAVRLPTTLGTSPATFPAARSSPLTWTVSRPSSPGSPPPFHSKFTTGLSPPRVLSRAETVRHAHRRRRLGGSRNAWRAPLNFLRRCEGKPPSLFFFFFFFFFLKKKKKKKKKKS